MSWDSASDPTGGTNVLSGINNGYESVVQLLQLLTRGSGQPVANFGIGQEAPLSDGTSPSQHPGKAENAQIHSSVDKSSRGSQQAKAKSSGFRKRTREGRYLSDITLDEVLQYVHLPSSEASKQLGLGLTSFKRTCRSLGIMTWPYKAGKQVSKELLISQALQSGRARNSSGTATPPVISKEAEASLDLLKSACAGQYREFMVQRITNILDSSRRMKQECAFTIYNDPVLMAILSKLSD